MGVIFTIVISSYLNEISFDFDKIWYTIPHLVPDDSYMTKCENLKNSRWRTAALLKIASGSQFSDFSDILRG